MAQSFGYAQYSAIPEAGFDGPVEDWTDYHASWRDVTAHFGSETLSMTVVEKEPGDEGVMHAHDPPVEEVYVVLSGELDLVLPDRVVEGAQPGTIAYFPPGLEHTTANSSDERAASIAFRALNGELDALADNVSVPSTEGSGAADSLEQQ